MPSRYRYVVRCVLLYIITQPNPYDFDFFLSFPYPDPTHTPQPKSSTQKELSVSNNQDAKRIVDSQDLISVIDWSIAEFWLPRSSVNSASWLTIFWALLICKSIAKNNLLEHVSKVL